LSYNKKLDKSFKIGAMHSSVMTAIQEVNYARGGAEILGYEDIDKILQDVKNRLWEARKLIIRKLEEMKKEDIGEKYE